VSDFFWPAPFSGWPTDQSISLVIGLILAANALAFWGLWSVLRDPALSAT
jgi:hypothetical protein